MISCGVHLELLINMSSSSLLAYIADNRMPDRIKLCKFKTQSLYLFCWFDTQARWFFSVLDVAFSSMLSHSSGPIGGSVQGEVKGIPYCHHRLLQTAKWFCSVL